MRLRGSGTLRSRRFTTKCNRRVNYGLNFRRIRTADLFFSLARPLRNFMRSCCESDPRMPSPKCLDIFASRGGTGSASTTGAGWSSIFFVGCAFLSSLFRHAMPDSQTRICLEQLGVVQESDHAALVIKVFWRLVFSVNCLYSGS